MAVSVAAGLDEVRRRIAEACARVGRDPGEVTIVAVSKEQPDRLVAAAIAAGVTDLGENRVGPFVRRRAAHPQARWHFVGQLQRRKARDVVGRAHLVHSLDRALLADTLDRLAQQAGVVQDVLVQVDLTDRPGRGGVPIDEVESLVAYASGLPGTRVTGLMTIPPIDGEPRESFQLLRAARDELRERWPFVTELSMGMSHDLESAVEEGATIVRPGTAIFGPRPTPPTQQDAA